MNQLGYYGKTTHRGDFVRFNLPRSFVTVWDDWMQQVMIHGESQCQDWASRYAVAPQYRFILSSGIAGNAPWIGLMRASEDKVGRRFPFCLAMSLSEYALPCHNIALQSRWFDEAESLLDRALSNDYEFENLQDELATLALHATTLDDMAVDPVTTNDRRSSDTLTISMMSLAESNGSATLAPLLDTVLRQTLGEYSLWLARDPAQATIVNSGLPSGDAGLALFTSDWRRASTAQIDLAALPSNRLQGDALLETGFAAAGSLPSVQSAETEDAAVGGDGEPERAPEFPADSFPDGNIEEPSTPTKYPAPETSTTPAPSADDWAALEEFQDSADPYAEVIVPKVEPLELDDDDLPDAPWEK